MDEEEAGNREKKRIRDRVVAGSVTVSDLLQGTVALVVLAGMVLGATHLIPAEHGLALPNLDRIRRRLRPPPRIRVASPCPRTAGMGTRSRSTVLWTIAIR